MPAGSLLKGNICNVESNQFHYDTLFLLRTRKRTYDFHGNVNITEFSGGRQFVCLILEMARLKVVEATHGFFVENSKMAENVTV
jgi:hypothetical protein